MVECVADEAGKARSPDQVLAQGPQQLEKEQSRGRSQTESINRNTSHVCTFKLTGGFKGDLHFPTTY